MATVLGATTSVIAGAAALASVANLATNSKYSSDSPLVPQPNTLSTYASYNYIISLGVLTDDQINNPDSTYMAGKTVPWICKSANADPYNRVKTTYGQFDFFVDNLQIDSLIGNDRGNNTNATNLSFDIIEPYSMGMFMIACQQAAYNANHLNWHDAPFLLKIEFRGNKSDGSMVLIPNTTRYMPFKFSALNMKVTQEGAKYSCQGYPWNAPAISSKHAKITSDVSIQGKTVKEMLQVGERSLQAVLNAKLGLKKEDKSIEVPNKIIILFPDDPSTGSAAAAGATENSSSATATPAAGGDVYSTIKVEKVVTESNDENYHQTSTFNKIGEAEMNFDATTKPTTPAGVGKDVYNEKLKGFDRSKLKVDYTLGQFQFVQGIDIPTVINQVILQSKYVLTVLQQQNIKPDGMIPWWRIDTHVYIESSDKNYESTGEKPKIIVYKVVPYEVHISSVIAPNAKPAGYEQLTSQVVKVYDYIFTGRNTEVLNFDINYEAAFMGVMATDNGNRSGDNQTQLNASGSKEKQVDGLKVAKGEKPSSKAGVGTSARGQFLTNLPTDGFGGGGVDTAEVRAAKLFHHVITNPMEMTALNMDIWGDPYFFAQSGQGNYIAKQTGNKNINKDGTVNWQSSQVDIIVNFRTPIDIDGNTGLYKFAGNKSAPVVKFSGLYQVTELQNKFRGGQFTQTLVGLRRPLQEDPRPGTTTATSVTTTTEPVKGDGTWTVG